MPCYSLTYPNVIDAESSMSEHLIEILRVNSISESTVQRCLLVISEAFTNAYVHGNRKSAAKHIRLKLNINSDQICADIIDEGSGGWEQVSQAAARSGEFPGPEAESGRGIALMKLYANKIDFAETENGGLKVTVSIANDKNEIAGIR